jgi:hypothetical protein
MSLIHEALEKSARSDERFDRRERKAWLEHVMKKGFVERAMPRTLRRARSISWKWLAAGAAIFLMLAWGARLRLTVQLPAAKAPYVLSGTIMGRERLALVNNKPVHVGETVDSARVLDIRDKEVILEESSGKLRSITLSK